MPGSRIRQQLAAWLTRLGELSEPPRRTAAAFSVGVFLSFSPFFGLQIAAGVLTAMALRLNRLAVLAGLCANGPWVMVPWYVATTLLGGLLLGVPLGEDAGARIGGLLELPIYRAAFWETAVALVRPVFWPFVLGSTLGAGVVAVLAYVAASRFLSRIRGENVIRELPRLPE